VAGLTTRSYSSAEFPEHGTQTAGRGYPSVLVSVLRVIISGNQGYSLTGIIRSDISDDPDYLLFYTSLMSPAPVTIIRSGTDVLLMREQEVLRKIRTITSERPDLLLSEVFPAGQEGIYRQEFIRNLKKNLASDKIDLVQEGRDWRITLRSAGKRFVLSRDDQKRLDSYFHSPGVPNDLQDFIQDYISKKTGKAWNDPVVLEKIRAAVVLQKGEYWKEGKKKHVRYEQGYRILAYLAYHFPVYFVQSGHILMMLAQAGLLKEEMTLLDAGSGPGVFALAVRDFLSRTGHGNAAIHAIEASGEHREAYTFLASRFAEGITGIEIRPPVPEDLCMVNPTVLPKGIDLLVFQNVLNELTTLTPAGKADKIAAIAGNLSPDGVVVIVEPADMVNATTMRETVRELTKKGLEVFAPCPPKGVRTCHPDRCWSFVGKPPVRPTRLMGALAAHPESYRFLNTDIKYSYAVLVREAGPHKVRHCNPGKKTAKLSGLSRHVDRRINISAAVMSGDLGNAKTHLWKLCDGSPQKPVYAVMPSYHATRDNALLLTAEYGDIVEMSGVLVRYNPHHDSYNLLVTRNTHVITHDNGKKHSSLPFKQSSRLDSEKKTNIQD